MQGNISLSVLRPMKNGLWMAKHWSTHGLLLEGWGRLVESWWRMTWNPWANIQCFAQSFFLIHISVLLYNSVWMWLQTMNCSSQYIWAYLGYSFRAMLGSVGHVDEAEWGAFPAAFRSASGSFAGHALSKACEVWWPKDCIMRRSKILVVCVVKIQYFWCKEMQLFFGDMFFFDLCLSLGGSSGAGNKLQKASRLIVQESVLVEIVSEATSTSIFTFQEIRFCSSGGFQLLYSDLCDQLHRQCCCRANPVTWIQAIQARYAGHFCTCQWWEKMTWMFEDGPISSHLGVIFLCT